MRHPSLSLGSLALCVAACGGHEGTDSAFSGEAGGSPGLGDSGGAAAGGTLGSGGPGAGGTLGDGGTQGGGGAQSSGGSGNGECTNIRPTGTMWDAATCDQWASETSECNNAWMIDNDYCNESCGRCDSVGSGGSGGGIPNTCTDPQNQVCSNQIGTHCGYTYEYWKDTGSGCQTNKSDGFSVNWNDINNLLGRKGRRPGSANHVVTYEANYQPVGNSYLCVYGWSRGPLAEYYIVDSWGDWRPPESGHMGTVVNSDGGTYDIYRTQRVNQPSIEGTRTFYQYWSVRTEKRTSGTITVKNHFDAWKALGMDMGSIYEVSMTVEGWQSRGTADVKMTID